jgi:adenylosuccinate synthase
MTTFVVTGLGYGDEGKGTAVDYLARGLESPVVIRATSGPQAAHNVVLPDGTSHTFAQFGSGFFAGADTLYAGVVCDPLAFVKEGKALESFDSKAFGRVIVSADSIVTTPYHQAGNRLKEILRGSERHGSCGYGVNEAVTLASQQIGLCVGDLTDDNLEKRLENVRAHYESFILNIMEHYDLAGNPEIESMIEFIGSEESVGYTADLYKEFSARVQVRSGRDIFDRIKSAKNRIFESAQGVLLDPTYGMFFPHVTRLSPFDVLRYLEDKDYRHVLCARTYMSRHGAGPLFTEHIDVEGYDPHNVKNKWQAAMRYGCLDLPSLRYAVRVVKAHNMFVNPKLFVTHEDIVSDGKYVDDYDGKKDISDVMEEALRCRDFSNPHLGLKICDELSDLFDPEFKETHDIVKTMEEGLGVKVGWVSSGMTYQDKTEL